MLRGVSLTIKASWPGSEELRGTYMFQSHQSLPGHEAHPEQWHQGLHRGRQVGDRTFERRAK